MSNVKYKVGDVLFDKKGNKARIVKINYKHKKQFLIEYKGVKKRFLKQQIYNGIVNFERIIKPRKFMIGMLVLNQENEASIIIENSTPRKIKLQSLTYPDIIQVISIQNVSYGNYSIKN